MNKLFLDETDEKCSNSKCMIDLWCQENEAYHCDHWYEDQGCCNCYTETINLIIYETNKEAN